MWVTDPQFKGRAMCQGLCHGRAKSWAHRAFPALLTHSLTFLNTSGLEGAEGKALELLLAILPTLGCRREVSQGVPGAFCCLLGAAVASIQIFGHCIPPRDNLELHLGKHESSMPHSS